MRHICVENMWLDWAEGHPSCSSCSQCEPFAFCTLCSCWAELPHLTSDDCKSAVVKSGRRAGPLLQAIYAAGEEAFFESAVDISTAACVRPTQGHSHSHSSGLSSSPSRPNSGYE